MSKPEPIRQRIGDAERDEATELLQDHLVAGRLTQAEFDERINAALTARTAEELKPLFLDLPGRKPSVLVKPEPESLSDQTRRRSQELMAEAKARNAVAEPPSTPNRALAILTAIAWPATLLIIFATSWNNWWLIFIPVMISGLAGKHHNDWRHDQREIEK